MGVMCMDIHGCGINIAERVKKYRTDNELSQRRFGSLVGVTGQAVCKWESGECYPDITLLPVLAYMIGCNIDDFFGAADINVTVR